jgi:hypothetical protein
MSDSVHVPAGHADINKQLLVYFLEQHDEAATAHNLFWGNDAVAEPRQLSSLGGTLAAAPRFCCIQRTAYATKS